ncbi:PTS N-acetylmuramic acid transporter subunit IIBC [Klebsiella pneumoniae]|uniref:PTS N-acetylmuramic acid transporter subunit IIBC n=1 Tax=Klebsiella pneumoniae TaxID=573 RepID=UPI002406ACE8|nr:PTS N-acetylmuramic acid transporter subunit IIBC [Klebsiella pneumoniae]MDG0477811.1 PTS N-acetylmuramic acid transporter subunit IIBC [Klebsiella pneumoniae]
MAKITKEMIARILAHVGGAANVAQAGNCMTRLRLTLRDESLADSAAIRQIDGVMGVIVSDEQFQVVLGPGKAQTAAEMMNGLLEAAPAAAPTLADVAAEKKQALKGKQTSAVQKFLAKFATIFTPLIPGFIAVGLLLGYNPEATSGFYAGISTFFGHGIDPRGNIIGVLIAAILGAWVERQVRRVMPANLDMILTSAVTLLIMGAVTFTVIMPIGGWLFTGMSWLFLHLNGNPFGSAVLAGLFLLAVMFGVHQGFVPVYFALVDAQGFNSLFPILAMAGAGQVGAALALFWRAKRDSLLRTQIKGAIIPGFLGIGEPLIYGVTLPRMKPFVTACLGGACGGFFVGLIAWLGLPVGLNTVFGPSGLVALPLMTSGSGIYAGMAVYAGGLAVSYLCGFVLTWLFGSKNVDLS